MSQFIQKDKKIFKFLVLKKLVQSRRPQNVLNKKKKEIKNFIFPKGIALDAGIKMLITKGLQTFQNQNLGR